MKHCVTQKHLRGQMITIDKKKPEKSPIEEPLDKDKPFVCPHCNKFYKYRSGISRHKKTCSKKPVDQITSLQKQNEDL